MSEELNLVAELAVILIAAGIFTVISKALKQPLILGYIVAGFIVSPHLGLIPAISGTESVHQWSEIGIIFLLFALGLEFSFKKLLKVGSSALITAGTICIGMFIVGMITGNALGWGRMECLFLGGMLSMSSTTVIIKAYDDLGLKKKPYATLIFGTLVVEDLIAVLLMVLLSTLAVSKQFSGSEMFFSLVRLAFFLILWFLVGMYVIPLLLKKAKRFLSDEILLIISIGLCFGMVSLASFAGFSSALGAFVMGSILAETVEGERIEHLLTGIKNLFGAIFFVSVGMMIDPAVIGQHWLTVIIIAIVAVAGILAFSTTGSLLAGQGLDNSVHVGFTMAQLGEFSFIIASLGCSLGVMRDFIYPVIIAVSVITTFTAPYMIKAGDPVSRWLAVRLPANILARINPRQNEFSGKSSAEKNEWAELLKSYILRVVLYSVILIAILLSSRFFLGKLAASLLPFMNEDWRKFLCLALTLVVMAPFLYGLAVTNGSINIHAPKLLKQPSNRWPILSLMIFRILIAIGFILAAITGYYSLGGWGVVAVIGAGLLFAFIAKRSFHRISGLEKRFIENLNAREAEERRTRPVTSSVRDKLSGYDIHTQVVEVSPDFDFIGKPLREMPFRKHSEINIIKIQRGGTSIHIPSGEEPIYPGDRLLAVGTTPQLASFTRIMEEHSQAPADIPPEPNFTVKSGQLAPDSFLTCKSLKDTEMRKGGCMIISVLHDNKLITNPGADFCFCEGDTVWIAGEEESCDWFLQ